MNIRTAPDQTGYAPRSMAWTAVDADNYQGGDPVGFGSTPESAAADLIDQIEDTGASTITITIPSNHPALHCVGGEAYQAAAGDLVSRARNALAISRAPECARHLMPAYFAAGSGSARKYELAEKLRSLGVTDFGGMIWDTPKPKGRIIARVHNGQPIEARS